MIVQINRVRRGTGERIAVMKEHRHYVSQQRITYSDQQGEGVVAGATAKDRRPIFIRKEPGKGVMPGNKNQEKAKQAIQHYLKERRRQREW